MNDTAQGPYFGPPADAPAVQPHQFIDPRPRGAARDELHDDPRARILALVQDINNELDKLPAVTVQPYGDRVLALMIERDDENLHNGVWTIRGDGAVKEPTMQALVLAVAPSLAAQNELVKGDTIICGEHVGHDVQHSGLLLRLIKKHDILAVLPVVERK